MAGDGVDRFRRPDLRRPGALDVARQLGIVVLVGAAWAGVFRFAMTVPGAEPEVRRARVSEAAEAPSSDIETAAPVDSAVVAPVVPPEAERTASAPETEPTVEAAAGPPPSSPPSSAAGEAAPETSGTGPSSATRAAASEVEPPSGNPGDPLALPADEAGAAALAAADELPEVSFVADVLPIMERRCVKCHGAPRSDGTPRLEEGLDLRSWDAIMAGSTWGSVVEPGDPVASYLLELVVDGDMPDDGPRLLPREIRVLTAWIAAGAPRN